VTGFRNELLDLRAPGALFAAPRLMCLVQNAARDRPEHATLTAVFLDTTGHSMGSPLVIGDFDARARRNSTGLVQREEDGRVRPGTRTIVVTVQFLSGITSFQNVYADNLTASERTIAHGW
jgi:hypothetical protein